MRELGVNLVNDREMNFYLYIPVPLEAERVYSSSH
ncbi:MAG: hypothetical protein ACJAXJ_001236 [Colwellia sp.]|jgi:hypothetical protein